MPKPHPQKTTQGTGDRVKILRQSKGEGAAGAGGVTSYLELQFPTKEGISLHDITPQLRQVTFFSFFAPVGWSILH
jgi:hypothetical protein